MQSVSFVAKLPFGRRKALHFDRAAIVARRQSELTTTEIDYRSLEADQDFRFAFSAIESRSLKIAANVSTAMEFTCREAPKGIVLISFEGGSSARQKDRTIEWSKGRNAVYLPPGTTTGASSQRVAMGIDVDPVRIGALVQTMLGEDAPYGPLVDFDTFRALDLHFGEAGVDQVFRQYAAMIEAINLDATNIERSGLADSIQRTIALMLAPQHFLGDGQKHRKDERGRISWICDYIEANLGEKITLTDLERLSGLSARTLQYAFRKTMGRTPMQWILDRRLEAVRRQILIESDATVSAIASQYFGNLGDFARYYKARFGERPSETRLGGD